MGRAADEIRDDANLLALKRFRNIKWDDSVLDGEWWRVRAVMHNSNCHDTVLADVFKLSRSLTSWSLLGRSKQ